MYAITAQGYDGPAVEIHGPRSLSAAFDYAMAFVRNPNKFHTGWTKTMRLVNVTTGKILKVWDVNQETVDLPALKLSDAMTRALSTTTRDGYVTGAANTLKALANKGLLQANGAKYQITNLGRQYQKKGA